MSRLNDSINELKKSSEKLKKFFVNYDFNVEEKELIRRVFKSVYPQMKNKRDRDNAQEILNKTEWLD
jgi:hypothetical protein